MGKSKNKLIIYEKTLLAEHSGQVFLKNNSWLGSYRQKKIAKNLSFWLSLWRETFSLPRSLVNTIFLAWSFSMDFRQFIVGAESKSGVIFSNHNTFLRYEKFSFFNDVFWIRLKNLCCVSTSIYGIMFAEEGSYSLTNAFPKLLLCLHPFPSLLTAVYKRKIYLKKYNLEHYAHDRLGNTEKLIFS